MVMYEVPRIHGETNWVGPFYRCVSKVKFWFAERFGLRMGWFFGSLMMILKENIECLSI